MNGSLASIRTVAMVATICSVMVCAGCANPRIAITVDPPDSLVFVDSRSVPRSADGSTVLPLSYYGTMSVSGRQAKSDNEFIVLFDQTKKVTVDEPFSPWLFPLDFLLEVATYPFQDSDYIHSVHIELADRPPIVDRATPENLQPIRARAKRALLDR